MNKGRAGEEYLYVTIETTRKLNDLKFGNNGKTFQWLKKERIFVSVDRWKTEKARTVGCILKINPKLTWKPDLQLTIRQALLRVQQAGVGGFVREEWEKKRRTRTGLVPEFALIHEKKSFGMGDNRVFTTVLNVEARNVDADYLKVLLTEAFQKGKLTGVFLQAGYHLSSSPKKLMGILCKQNEYLNECRTVTILGVRDRVMEKQIEVGEWRGTMKEYLIKFWQVASVERTAQTEHLGKWYLLTTAAALGMVKTKVDRQLSKICELAMGENDQIGGFLYPRRNNGLTTGEKHEEYTKSVEEKMGVSKNDDHLEVEVVQQNGRKKWKMGYQPQEVGENPVKRQKTWATAASGGSSKEIRTASERESNQPESKGVETTVKERTYEEKVREMNAAFDVKLREHETLNERRLMDEKSESNSRLAKALEVNRAQNIKCIKEMIQDNEKKVRDIIQENDLNIRDLLTTQDEKASERDERVEERLMNMEKMIRTLAQQSNIEGRGKGRTVTRSTEVDKKKNVLGPAGRGE